MINKIINNVIIEVEKLEEEKGEKMKPQEEKHRL